MKSFRAALASCVVLAMAMFGVSAESLVPRGFQEPKARIVDLELSELEIGKAVAYLFAKVNGKYSLAPNVKGVTTVSLRGIPFEDALANVLRQVNATWRVKDGIYEIALKPQPEIDWGRVADEDRELYGEDVREVLARLFKGVGIAPAISPHVQGRVKISDSDLKDITFEAALQKVLKQANATYRVSGGVYEIVPQDVGKTIVSIRAENEDIREVLRRLFKNVGVSYSIEPEVRGTVTVQLTSVSFEAALGNILKQVDATYGVEAGIYMIVKPRIRFGGGPFDSRYIVQEPEVAPAITMDDRHLFVLVGKRLFKVNKSDLKTVLSTIEFGSDSRDQSKLAPIEPRQSSALAVDGKFVYVLRGMMLSKVNKSDLKTVVQRKLGE